MLDRPTLIALVFGSLGGAALQALGLPAGWLCGSMFAVMAIALRGIRVRMPEPVRNVALLVIGVSMGTAITPEILGRAAAWPLSLTLLVISVAATMQFGTFYLQRRWGWDNATARLASVPGALSAVLAIGADSRGDMVRISVSQGLRQVLLVGLVPLLFWITPEAAGLARPNMMADLPAMALMLAVGTVAGLLCRRIGLPGGLLAGAMIGSGALQATGLVIGGLPMPVLIAAYVILGSSIGAKLYGVTRATLVAVLRPSLGATLGAEVIAGAFAATTSALLDLPLLEVWLAFAPGGVEAMTVLAYLLNLDPGFVSAHHVVRLLLLMLLSPLWTRGLRATIAPSHV